MTNGYLNRMLTVSYSVKKKTDTEYYSNDGNIDHKTEKLNNIKDLGVTFDSSLTFHEHIQLHVNKAYIVLSLIKRNFIYRPPTDRNTLVLLYINPWLDHIWNKQIQCGHHIRTE